jgi:putative SOS response-associated peptidase YedK
MCGRFTNTTTNPEKLQESFDLKEIRTEQLHPRYNIAPTQSISTIVANAEGERFLGHMRWGLIPAWHKDPTKLGGHINARSETAADKPTFRSAFKKRRCLVVADGFYEWKVQPDKSKTPMYIHLHEHEPFGMAGLWERWTNPETGEVLVSCTILTTHANEMMSEIHERMPVILPHTDYQTWLDPTLEDKALLQSLMQPYPAEEMTTYQVSTLVNNVRNDEAALVEQVVS